MNGGTISLPRLAQGLGVTATGEPAGEDPTTNEPDGTSSGVLLNPSFSFWSGGDGAEKSGLPWNLTQPPLPRIEHPVYGTEHFTQDQTPADPPQSASAQLTQNLNPTPSAGTTDGSSSSDLAGEHQTPPEALLSACAAGDLHAVADLLQLDSRVKDGRPPPSVASVNVGQVAGTGSGAIAGLPLHAASKGGHLDVVMLLVDRAAAIVDLTNKEGETALMKAALNGHVEVVRFLLERNANAGQKDRDGWTALHNCSSRGHVEVARLLIEAGADVNASSDTGFTPLMTAASNGCNDIVSLLLTTAFADPCLRNRNGDSAHDLAAQSELTYTCEILRRAEVRWIHWQRRKRNRRRRRAKGKERAAGSPVTPSTASVAGDDTASSIITTDTASIQTTSSVLPVVPLRNVIIEEVFEYQRRPPASSSFFSTPSDPTTGFSPSHLTHSDFATRGAWWSRTQVKAVPNLAAVRLPSAAGEDWFWWSEWRIDSARPDVDPEDGWQYAWGPIEDETDLEDELNGTDVESVEGDTTSREHGGDVDLSKPLTISTRWAAHPSLVMAAGPTPKLGQLGLVRRRRWIRVRRRKVDVVALMDSTMSPTFSQASEVDTSRRGKDRAVELDYLGRAEILVAELERGEIADSGVDGARKREEAIEILLGGSKHDPDEHRKTKALALSERLITEAEGIVSSPSSSSTKPKATPEEATTSTASTYTSLHHIVGRNNSEQSRLTLANPPLVSTVHATAVRSGSISSTASRSSSSETTGLDQVSSPTAEADFQLVGMDPAIRSLTAAASLSGWWQPDETALECGNCKRKFTLFFRRHHCRSCGRVFCDPCTANRLPLAHSQEFDGVSIPLPPTMERVCENCFTRLSNAGRNITTPVRQPSLQRRISHPTISSTQTPRTPTPRQPFAWSPGWTLPPPPIPGSTASVPSQTGPGTSASSAPSSSSPFARALSLGGPSLGSSNDTTVGTGGAAGNGLGLRSSSTSSVPTGPHAGSSLFSNFATSLASATQTAWSGLLEAVEDAVTTIQSSSADANGESQRRPARQAGASHQVGDHDDDDDEDGYDSDEAPAHMSDSIMNECPVCQRSLVELHGLSTDDGGEEGDAAERHVADCLRKVAVGRGVGMVISGNRYIAQTLKESLEGPECVICFNDMEAGDRIARLNCLCIYHEHCIEEWFKRKNSCPVHYK